ncbi:MAG: Glycosyl transferase family protein [Microgenomates group bacterium Gr01-1014_16]|nr:MAG: Glycosyl transferase family protein [Microgenomates group bacterium Gr01-1014_16]
MLSWRGPRHPNAGGAEIVTLEHLKAWANAGHQVFWFTSGTPSLPPEEIIDQIHIIRRGFQILQVQLEAVLWYLFSPHPKFDLVVDQFHGIPFFTPLFVRTKKLAFIHEVAKEVWWINHLRFPVNYLFGAIGFFLEPFIFKLFYRRIPFFTVSQSTKNDLVDWSIPPSHIHIIPNGVISLPANFPKEKKPTVIFLGAIAKDKGIEDALVAIRPQWQFWVVGKGEDKYLSSLQIPQNVKFWGFVDEHKKFELLARAHVMLNPSVREGWGLVNIEANSVGTPVVAYDVPGCRDSIKHQITGFLCPKGDIICLSQTITKLIRDQSLYRQISTSAKSWSKEFTWDKSTHLSLKLIENIYAFKK